VQGRPLGCDSDVRGSAGARAPTRPPPAHACVPWVAGCGYLVFPAYIFCLRSAVAFSSRLLYLAGRRGRGRGARGGAGGAPAGCGNAGHFSGGGARAWCTPTAHGVQRGKVFACGAPAPCAVLGWRSPASPLQERGGDVRAPCRLGSAVARSHVPALPAWPRAREPGQCGATAQGALLCLPHPPGRLRAPGGCLIQALIWASEAGVRPGPVRAAGCASGRGAWPGARCGAPRPQALAHC